MTATEELRRLLDERGVEWVDTGDGSTLIPVQAATNVAWDVNTWPSGKDMGDCLWVQNRHPLTPAQAVEATLGRERTCHWDYPQNINGWTGEFACSNCGHQFDGVGDWVWEYCPNCGAKVVDE